MKRPIQFLQTSLNEPEAKLEPFDVLIVAGGTDSRVYEVSRRLRQVTSVGAAYFFDYTERRPPDGHESLALYEEFFGLGFSVTTIPCSVLDPSACVKSLAAKGVTFEKEQRIALDITGFTRPYMFVLLKFLKEQVGCSSVTVLYSEPHTYKFPEGVFSSYRASAGPLTVVEVPGYPGYETRSKESILVVILGFDGALSEFLADEIAPNRAMVVNGFPAYFPKFKDISMINNEKLLGACASRDDSSYAKAQSPFEVFNILESLSKKYESAFISIAPLGPKPMALGACLFALIYPSTRIVYPLPKAYAQSTTTQVGLSWAYTVPLSLD